MLKHTLDLKYLRMISDGDLDFMKDLLRTFVKTTPEALDELREALASKDWTKMGRVMHKVKPSYLLIDVPEVSELVKSLEFNAKNSVNIPDIPDQVASLLESSEELMATVKTLLAEDDF